MKLSVIILNYNVHHFLELCLKSVEAATTSIEAEIVVVDNNSSDDSCTMVQQLFPRVKLISNKENFGFSKGNNIGVAQAKGEYICVLNPDTVVAEDTFTKILAFADSKSDAGVIGCQLIDGRGNFLPESKREVPTPKIALQKLLGKTKTYYYNSLIPDDIGATDILVGAFMILKRRVYREVKGFDEDYFMYGEDIDLSYKVLKAGYKNYYYGGSAIIHFKGESTLKDKVYSKRFYNAMGIFYRKHFTKSKLMIFVVSRVLKLVSLFGHSFKTEHILIEQSKVVSKDIDKRLKNVLIRPITFTSKLDQDANNTLIVFDSDYLSFKTIINYMKSHDTTKQNAFRILLKSSNFILGSDSSTGQGEVIHFN
ncbi:MAG: glycosyltransferase family 2 protein [Winogradskyella sp.]|uniref:glycosyltransferase family 2 protein n=1 Tax=Winogradskyella sp. TaxID=1883156 RepID=UPI0025E24DE0|nr:glycosyltransferase family 2 protein [Winogradskyella sp.]NRB83932.1 glycosyltransferase family 2 protein [Winogradskyella sp.]